jgi:hypothetical protein
MLVVYAAFQLIGLAVAAVAVWVGGGILSSQPHWLVRFATTGFIASTLAIGSLASARMWNTYSDSVGQNWTALSSSTFIVNFWTWFWRVGVCAIAFLLLLLIASWLGVFV